MPIIFITVAFRWKHPSEWQYRCYESKALKDSEVEPYIEQMLRHAVRSNIKVCSIEVRNHVPPNRWGEPGWKIPWEWRSQL